MTQEEQVNLALWFSALPPAHKSPHIPSNNQMERPCDHLYIVAKQGGRVPEDFADCFRILGQMGVISTHLRESLQSMARFRNVLIHLYWEVDDGTVSKEIDVLKA